MNLTTILIAFVIVPLILFALLLIIFLRRQKKRQSDKSAVLQQVMSNSSSKYTMDVFYQRSYMALVSIPIIRTYVYKIRRRMELFSNDDEYMIRKDTARISLRVILLTLFFAIVLAFINRENLFMMLVSFIGVLVVAENFT